MSHQSRPWSPYRHAPTNEDLLSAATRGRALIFPEEKELSNRAKTPSAAHSKAASVSTATPPRQSKAASRVSKQPSVVPSHHTGGRALHGDGEKTPTPSRPHTPEELNADEEKIVEAIASAMRTPRTSYYSPSSIGADLAAQYHDMELCVLFGQLNDPKTHEYIKKAVRKAVRQRVKRLGMKYDNEVRNSPYSLVFLVSLSFIAVHQRVPENS